MPDHLHTPEMKFQFTLVDIRELDGEPLLTSPELSDNVIGILTRFRNKPETLRGILRKLAGLELDRSAFYFRALMTLAELRGLGKIVEEEAKNMPTTENILDHEVIGREYRREEVSLLKLMMEKRFGALPAWVDDRLQQRSIPELEDLGVRLLDAHSLEELLG